MYVVPARRSPSGPAVAEVAFNSSHGMSLGSTVTPSARAALTLPRSLACQVGPTKWATMTWPESSLQVGACGDEGPGVAGGARVAPVDLHAGGVPDQEQLMAGRHRVESFGQSWLTQDADRICYSRDRSAPDERRRA